MIQCDNHFTDHMLLQRWKAHCGFRHGNARRDGDGLRPGAPLYCFRRCRCRRQLVRDTAAHARRNGLYHDGERTDLHGCGIR